MDACHDVVAAACHCLSRTHGNAFAPNGFAERARETFKLHRFESNQTMRSRREINGLSLSFFLAAFAVYNVLATLNITRVSKVLPLQVHYVHVMYGKTKSRSRGRINEGVGKQSDRNSSGDGVPSFCIYVYCIYIYIYIYIYPLRAK